MKQIIASGSRFCLVQLLVITTVYGYQNRSLGYTVEPPLGMHEALELSPNQVAFQSSDKSLTLGVAVLPAMPMQADAIEANLQRLLPVQLSEYEAFRYYNLDALAGVLHFSHQQQSYVGNFMVLISPDVSYWLYGFSLEADYEHWIAYIYSTFDSFSLNRLPATARGLLSSYSDAISPQHWQTEEIILENKKIQLKIDVEQEELSQDFIEREAKILSSYSGNDALSMQAWARYYRMIFRDNYDRLAPVAQALKPSLAGKDDSATARVLLSFSQNFTYTRSPHLMSDLISPVSGALRRVGDCDSMSMLYILLLAHYDMEASLLLTQQKAHAVVGVSGVSGDTITLRMLAGDKKTKVYAELTMHKPLGYLPEELLSATDWYEVNFLIN
jgi:hypothetical protein